MRLLTIGTFDVPHLGHASFLRRCEKYASEVLVGVNSDRFVLEYKKADPVFTWVERASLISGLGYKIFLNDGPGRELIMDIHPDVVGIGSDWLGRDYHAQIDMTAHEFDEEGIALLYIPYTKGISTTALKERLGR